MAHMKKAEAEKLFVEHVKSIGISWWSATQGEGHCSRNLYYCFTLKDHTQRFWTNLSEQYIKELGLNEDREGEG